MYDLEKKPSENSVSRFLDEVTDQIAWKPLRPSIRRELEEHIEDLADELKNEGIESEEAFQQAVRQMGDPIIIGTELNAVHQIRRTPVLTVLSLLLLLAGFVLAGFMNWTPEQNSGGYLYYLPGTALLLLTVWKGYPFFIRHWKCLSFGIGILYLFFLVLNCLFRFGHVSWVWPISYLAGTFFPVLFLPVPFSFLFYRFRKSRKRTIQIGLLLAAAWGIFSIFFLPGYRWSAAAIALLSLVFTMGFMIQKHLFSEKKWKLWSFAAVIAVLLASPAVFLHPYYLKAFTAPQTQVRDHWNDTYNSVLIQELLSRTPFAGGLSLSPEELMDYRTGAWYFASREPRNISIAINDSLTPQEKEALQQKWHELNSQGFSPGIVHETEETVTLWDILPQHYHNNYIIAVVIFLSGWIGGFLLLAAIALFYLLLFRCILKIRGNLASCTAFACGQILLWQTILYILGNFGFQYCAFPNLPLLSEGRISMVFNMVFVGFILSAYRYDLVTAEPAECTSTVSL